TAGFAANSWRLARHHWRKSLFIIFLLIAISFLALAPLPSSLYKTPYASILAARDGQLLGASIASDQQWRFAPVDSLPEKYQQALMRFEDQYFYYHIGIDPTAIARA